MRGKPVRKGLKAEGEGLAEHVVGDYIRSGREQGIPEEEIRRVLRDEFEVPEDEISRLGKVFPPRRLKQ